MSVEIHRRAEALMSQGDRLLSLGDTDGAAQAYAQAGREEAEAFEHIPAERVKTRGMIATSAVSLLQRGRELEEAMRLAHSFLARYDLPDFARLNIEQVLDELRTEIAEERAGWIRAADQFEWVLRGPRVGSGVARSATVGVTIDRVSRFGIRVVKYLPFLVYVALIVGANWAIATFGTVSVLFTDLMAPAGVYLAGFTFAARNFTQQSLGRRWGYIAIVGGAALSAALAPPVELGGWLPLPLASGGAFLLSETADMLIWTPLRSKGLWVGAMVFGELGAQFADSAVFLLLAFGSLELLAGQVVGKWETVIPVVACMWLARALVQRRKLVLA